MRNGIVWPLMLSLTLLQVLKFHPPSVSRSCQFFQNSLNEAANRTFAKTFRCNRRTSHGNGMGCSCETRNPLLRYLISSEAFRILVAHLAHTLLDSATFFSQEKPSSVTRSARRHFSTPARLDSSNKFSVETLRLKSP